MAKYIFVTGGVTSSLGKGHYCRFACKTFAGKGLDGLRSRNLILISMLIPAH